MFFPLRRAALFFIPALLACASPDIARNIPVGATYDRAEDINSKVKLELYHEKNLPIGPGFSVYVSGWEANDSVEVFAYDEKKTRVDIVAGNKRLPVSPEGTVSFSVPYKFHAFRPGRWLIIISGASGNHGHYVDIPNVK